MMNASEVEVMQNSVPTDWSKFDQQLTDRSNYDTNRHAGDSRLHVMFFMRPLLDRNASEAAQRPIYRDAEFVRIMIPGDKQNIIEREVGIEEDERQRFPEYYAKFKAGLEQIVGTPLNLAPFLTPALVEEYKHFHVRTIEQLADLSDGTGAKFMGFHEHKRKAREFLDRANGVEALRAEKDSEIAELRKALAELEEKITAPQAPQVETSTLKVKQGR